MDREQRNWILTVGKIITAIVYTVVVVYIIILTLAFFLQLFGANPAASFAEWVYTAAARIMEPFRGIFPTKQITERAVFNASLLFAIIVYAIVAMLLHSLITWLTSRLTAIKYQADRDRQLAQAESVQNDPYVPVTPTPTSGGVAPAGAGAPPPRG